ncbi:hypothetical protein PR002_g14928 [Phytophthora rubi]|uniref:Secreted peptide n=1 Tax=Phytophthora rubi TaxID=129364 RepID=A0A6A3KX90_9STRA|nr:hypothetical protein PR002_g14928 [Phytophthora rubi]
MGPFLVNHAALLVAVVLHRYRLFLSCCSASSSATAPMRSFLLCCSASSSATAPIPSISIMLLYYTDASISSVLCCSASSSATALMSSFLLYHAALLLEVAVLLHRWRPFLSCCSASSSATGPIPSISIMLLCYR